MRCMLFLAVLLAACSSGAAERDAASAASSPDTSASAAIGMDTVGGVSTYATGGVGGGASSPPVTGSRAAGARAPIDAPEVIRGLYVNRFAAQTRSRLERLMAIADSTEINGFVVDMKDEFGLNFESSDSMLIRNAGSGMGRVRDLRALTDTLKARGIVPMARIVVFKDSVAARANPQHTIRTPDGSVWRDEKGLAWVNPYDRTVWEYNIRVAEEVARAGFTEIHFDYIRFPEPYRRLATQVFPGSGGLSKPDALAEFLRAACPRVNALGARCTAHIFGLVTTVNGPLEVGQQWEKLAPVTDVLLPMVYPSHYPRGSFGVDRPNAEPYRIIHTAIKRAHERNAALGITTGERVRPWLQAFDLGQPRYGPEELRAQKRAVYDAGYQGWVLWHPGSNYNAVRAGLDRAGSNAAASP
jgi:hypothetical protein